MVSGEFFPALNCLYRGHGKFRNFQRFDVPFSTLVLDSKKAILASLVFAARPNKENLLSSLHNVSLQPRTHNWYYVVKHRQYWPFIFSEQSPSVGPAVESETFHVF